MKGVEEANGWLQYTEVEQGHETISYEQTSESNTLTYHQNENDSNNNILSKFIWLLCKWKD